MNGKVVVLLATLLLVSGCAATEEMLSTKQELIKISPLPQLVSTGFEREAKMGVIFRVLGDGTIAEVRMMKPARDKSWESAAVDSMMHWHFSAIRGDSLTEGRWIHYLFNIREEEPIAMTLGEIKAAGEREADSLYALLKSGVAFEVLANQVDSGSSVERGKFLGQVDIARYTERVRNELRRLDVNDFTHPVRLGNNYVIYVRFERDASGNLVQ